MLSLEDQLRTELTDWLQRLPEARREPELAKLEKAYAVEVESKPWNPPHHPWPKQQMFLDLTCLEAFFGGAASGGKSDALLMAALQYVHVPGYAALILRRDFARLNLSGAIMERSKAWLRGTAAVWHEQSKRWTFPSGATIEFGYIDSPDDRYRYASSEYQCVAKGTMVKTPTGLKRVEDIQSGDVVLTLSGPRKVIRTFAPRTVESVRIVSEDGWQDCPVTHRVLTEFGWMSYKALASFLCLSVAFSPKSLHAERIFDGPFCRQFQCVSQTLRSIPARNSLLVTRSESCFRRQVNAAHVAELKDAETESEAYCGYNPETRRPGELSCLGVLHAPWLRPVDIAHGGRPLGSGDFGGQISMGVVAGCQGSYLLDSGPCDEQLPRESVGVRSCPPLRFDVEQRNHSCLRRGATENTPSHSHSEVVYAHPYKREFRCLSEGVRFSPLRFLPIGKRLVYDFTVEDCNNYISSSNVVNVNCICFDELTEFRLPDGDANPYQFLFSRLRKTRDINVPLRMRSASNPGNIGHRYVKQRFITDEAMVALAHGESGVLDGPAGRKFVPARVRDNPAVDPAEYELSLSHLGAVTRARLMLGDWTVSEGTQIDPGWLQYYEMNGQLMKFGNNGTMTIVDERVCRRFAVIDTAGTSKEKAAEDRGRPPSWSVCGTFDHSTTHKTTYVRDVSRWRVAYPELKIRVKAVLLKWHTPKCYVENAHFGPALVADLQQDRELRGVKFELIPTKIPGMKADGEGAKLERATAAGLFDELEHGRFRLPAGPETPVWLSDYEAELSSWTGRAEETADQIDISSYACYVTRRQMKTWAGKGVVAGGGFRQG